MSDYNLNDFQHNKKQFKDKGKDKPSPTERRFHSHNEKVPKTNSRQKKKKTITNQAPLVEDDKVAVAKPQT